MFENDFNSVEAAKKLGTSKQSVYSTYKKAIANIRGAVMRNPARKA